MIDPVNNWNLTHPIGRVVVTLDDGSQTIDVTASRAWNFASYLGHGRANRAMVLLDAAGPYPIGNVRKVRDNGQ